MRRAVWSAALVRAAVLLTAVAATTLGACEKGGAGVGAAGAEGEEHPLVGVQAPGFELKHGDTSVQLESLRGKVVIVDFWATWCEPCKDSFPIYQALEDKYSGQVVIVAISEDEEAEGIDGFVAETGARFSVVWDEGQTAAEQYSPPTMPTSYVLDQNGIVRYVHAGFRAGDGDIIQGQVEALLE